MPRYKKHIVRYGETMQSIASLEVGDVSYWTEIAKYNKLHFPYIVDSDEKKVKDVEHLVTIGDIIIIPKETTLSGDDIDSMTIQDKDEVTKYSLGEDLSMIDIPNNYQDRGTQDEIFQLNDNGKGDLQTVVGVENIKQVLMARLLTPKGALILHPKYGSNLHNLFIKGNETNVQLIDDEIARSIKEDGRVYATEKVSSVLDEGVYTSTWKVSLISLRTQFELLIGRDNNGNFIIE